MNSFNPYKTNACDIGKSADEFTASGLLIKLIRFICASATVKGILLLISFPTALKFK